MMWWRREERRRSEGRRNARIVWSVDIQPTAFGLFMRLI